MGVDEGGGMTGEIPLVRPHVPVSMIVPSASMRGEVQCEHIIDVPANLFDGQTRRQCRKAARETMRDGSVYCEIHIDDHLPRCVSCSDRLIRSYGGFCRECFEENQASAPLRFQRQAIPRKRKGFVYFIRAKGDPSSPIKIGWTTNIIGRLEALQTGFPHELEVVGSTPGDIQREKDLHKRFSGLRLRGEWFSPSADLLEYIREECKT